MASWLRALEHAAPRMFPHLALQQMLLRRTHHTRPTTAGTRNGMGTIR